MTRELVLVGKIGPAFNAVTVIGHGSAAARYPRNPHPDAQRSNVGFLLEACFCSIADNMAQHGAYRFDVATNDGMFR